MKIRQYKGGIPFNFTGEVYAKKQLTNYQYFRQMFFKNMFDFNTLVVSI
mgnify:CR=1